MNADDLDKANQLFNRIRIIQGWAELVKPDSKIIGIAIEVPGAPPLNSISVRGAIIPTEGMQYPPQMLQSIHDQLDEQWKKIADELVALGATEVPYP